MTITAYSAEVTNYRANPPSMLNPIYAGGKLRVAYGKYTILGTETFTGAAGDNVVMTVPIPKGAILVPMLSTLLCADLGDDCNVSVGIPSSLALYLAAQAADDGATVTQFPRLATPAALTADSHVCVAIIDDGTFVLTPGATIEVWIVYADNN